jgi:hypothetical protein
MFGSNAPRSLVFADENEPKDDVVNWDRAENIGVAWMSLAPLVPPDAAAGCLDSSGNDWDRITGLLNAPEGDAVDNPDKLLLLPTVAVDAVVIVVVVVAALALREPLPRPSGDRAGGVADWA